MHATPDTLPTPQGGAHHTVALIGACLSSLTLGLLVVGLVLLFAVKAPERKLTVNGEQTSARQAALELGGALLDAVRPGNDESTDRQALDVRWEREEPAAHRAARWMLWACLPLGALGSLLGGIAYFGERRGVLTLIAIWPFMVFVAIASALPSCSA